MILKGPKLSLREIDGILLLNKDIHASSNTVLQQVKFLYRAQKAGHTGSLDPLASGMLPICFGEATKFCQFLLDSDKSYFVQLQLGIKTSTGDGEGEVISQRPVPTLSQEDIEDVFQQFTGEIQQTPSMYSALKFQGKPLYLLARQGITVERAARSIKIYSIRFISFKDASLCLEVHCSKGTYIRNLVEDMGEVLGCGAYVTKLHRLWVGSFESQKMLNLTQLEEVYQTQGLEGLDSQLLPVDTAVIAFPSVLLEEDTTKRLLQGQKVVVPHSLKTGDLVRLQAQNGLFLGMGSILEDGRIAAKRLLRQSS